MNTWTPFSSDYVRQVLYKKEISFVFGWSSQFYYMWAGITHIELGRFDSKLFRMASRDIRHLIACIFFKGAYKCGVLP